MDNNVTAMEHFFIKCSGSSIELLLQCSESERKRHYLYGVIIFLTSIFAFFSSFYAFLKVFEITSLAILLASIWASFIFNVDRLIVLSMRKHDSGWQGRLREFIQLLPRAALAVLLALAISRPIEIIIFEKKIARFMVENEEKNKQKQDAIFIASIAQIRGIYKAKRESVNGDALRLQQEIDEAQRNENEARDKLTGELYGSLNGKPSGSGTKGNGPIAKELNKRYLELSAIRQRLEEKNLQEINNIKELNKRQLESIDGEEKVAIDNAGANTAAFKTKLDNTFSERLAELNSALTEMTAEDKGAKYLHLVIALIFLVVEMAPVTVKFLSHKRQYDYLLDEEDENARKKKTFSTKMNECLFDQFEKIKSGHSDISITHPSMRDCLIESLEKLLREWVGDNTLKRPSKTSIFSSMAGWFSIDRKHVTLVTFRLTTMLIIISAITYPFLKIRGVQDPLKDTFNIVVIVLTVIQTITAILGLYKRSRSEHATS